MRSIARRTWSIRSTWYTVRHKDTSLLIARTSLVVPLPRTLMGFFILHLSTLGLHRLINKTLEVTKVHEMDITANLRIKSLAEQSLILSISGDLFSSIAGKTIEVALVSHTEPVPC